MLFAEVDRALRPIEYQMDKAFVKALQLLEALALSDEPRGITSLAAQLGLTKSNVHRLLGTLQAHGYVEQIEAKGSYRLTTKLWELGSNVVGRLDVVEVARDAMKALATQTGETVHLSILDRLEVIYLDKIESEQPVRSYTRVGARAPAWCVATGKAILAFQPDETIKSVARGLKPFTPFSIRSVEELQTELARVRARGYAINQCEWREDVCGVGAPIRDSTGRVVAAIGISGPATRLKKRQLKDFSSDVIAAANRTSLALGFRTSLASYY